MAEKNEIKIWRQHLAAERNAGALYATLAAAEPLPATAALYRKLADTEQRHAAYWEQRLRAAGAAVPAAAVSWRARALGWLARRFGPQLVLPTIADSERNAGAEYGGSAEPAVIGMAGEERSHARVFRALAAGGGLAGGAVARLEGRHKAAGGNALRAGVLGANDGLLSNFSLIMGVAGAQVSGNAILVTGLAGLLAGAISMALGEWLSVQSSRELYRHQIQIEADELRETPEEEQAELALIYQAKGLAPDEARRLAERLLSDPEHALDTLAREELGVDPQELGGSAWVAAGTSFLLFALGAIIPLAPFFFMTGRPGVVWSAGVSAAGLFGIGAAITLLTSRPVFWSGFRQVLFGLAAAAVTFGIGRLVGAHLG